MYFFYLEKLGILYTVTKYNGEIDQGRTAENILSFVNKVILVTKWNPH